MLRQENQPKWGIKMELYEVTEWAPAVCGGFVGAYAHIGDVVAAAQGCYQAQITHPRWGGYVVTWVGGDASAKYFPGHDAHGFGGEIPEDAALLVAKLGR